MCETKRVSHVISMANCRRVGRKVNKQGAKDCKGTIGVHLVASSGMTEHAGL
jgi:hypothetical protein